MRHADKACSPWSLSFPPRESQDQGRVHFFFTIRWTAAQAEWAVAGTVGLREELGDSRLAKVGVAWERRCVHPPSLLGTDGHQVECRQSHHGTALPFPMSQASGHCVTCTLPCSAVWASSRLSKQNIHASWALTLDSSFLAPPQPPVSPQGTDSPGSFLERGAAHTKAKLGRPRRRQIYAESVLRKCPLKGSEERSCLVPWPALS